MSPEKIAMKREAARVREINDVAAIVGLPAAQRDPNAVVLTAVPQIGKEPVTSTQTVRKLSRVEKLRRSGVLEPHEADACEWFADTSALAWDTVGCTANYEGASGSCGGAHAPDKLMARYKAQGEARKDYRFAAAALPGPYRGIFESIICRNNSVSSLAEERFGELARSQREQKTRTILKLCANRLHEAVGHRLTLR